MTDLPPGWTWVHLSDIVQILDSSRVPVSAKEREKRRGTIPYYGATGQVGWIDEAIFNEQLILLGEDGVQFLDPRKKKAYLISGPSWVNNHAHVLRATEELVDRAYLCNYLNIFNYEGYANGTTRLKLTQAAMRSIPVPLPPRPEQRRIVATLEEYLTDIYSAANSLQLDLKRAKSLRIKILEEAVTTRSGNWKSYTLGEVAESVRNGMYVSRPDVNPDGVPILRISSVRTLRLNFSDARYSRKSIDEVNQSGHLLSPGDLLFTRYNGNPEYVGSCAVVPEKIDALTYPDKLIRVRTDRSIVLPQYLALACSVGESRAAIRNSVKTTAGQAGISGRELKSIPIRLPDLKDQKHIVDQFVESDSTISRMESTLESALKKSSALHSSIIAKAFSGRLVPQNQADEPASVLLARIRGDSKKGNPDKVALF